MAELSVPSREPASTERRARGQRLPSRECGPTLAGLGAGALGIPWGPTFAGRKGNRIYFGESIRNKVIRGERLRGDYRFKRGGGGKTSHWGGA